MKNFSHRKLLLISAAVLATGNVIGNPQGGQVAAGSATISTAPGTVTIQQQSNTAIINWQNFSISSGELTKFVQPSAMSAALNRVTSGNPSSIYGTLQANGQVYLINPNGVLVGPGGVINTSSFIASTRDISDADFLAGGDLHFTGNSAAGVQNLGKINALGGDVYLLGHTVDNRGTISAPNGTVGLAAADDIRLAQAGTEHVFVSSSSTTASGAGQTAVHNSGSIAATAAELKAANGNAYALAINNEGTIRASTVKNEGGRIFLVSDSGTVSNSGKLDASATAAKGQGGSILLKTSGKASHTGAILAKGGQGGIGGNVEISGKGLEFTGTIDTTSPGGTTGNLLLDPTTLEVINGGTGMVVGGMNDSNSQIDPTVVDAALAGANLTLNADSAITITSPIQWTSGNQLALTLNFPGTIAINAPITALGSSPGGLVINAPGSSISTGPYGTVEVGEFNLQAGNWVQNATTLPTFAALYDFEVNGSSTFLRVTGGSGSSGSPYQIADIYGLQGISGYATQDFEQTGFIDASSTSNWNTGSGFASLSPFSGVYNGNGNQIYNLTIYTPGNAIVGLFRSNTGTITNLNLYATITGNNYVGGIAGFNSGTISSVSVGGSITAQVGEVGGITGYNGPGHTISSVSANAQINATGSNVGGLIGENAGALSYSYAQGAVENTSGANATGGLVGINQASGTIVQSYANGPVDGVNASGGLVGQNYGSIREAYSTGPVSGAANVGGLVGQNLGQILQAYSIGSVVGSSDVGGLVGINQKSGSTISETYATGRVTLSGSGTTVGGLEGANDSFATIKYSYWDQTTTGRFNAIGADSNPSGDTPNVALNGTNSPYTAGSYANLGSVSAIAGADTGSQSIIDTHGGDPEFGAASWYVVSGATRPFLAFENPSTASLTVANAHQLQLIAINLAQHYQLLNYIDASGTSLASSGNMWSSAGFVPIGDSTTNFTGSLDGKYQTVDSLYINNTTAGYVGLFGRVQGTGGVQISDLYLTNMNVTGQNVVGGLAGYVNNSQISGVTLTGALVTGSGTGAEAGGLIGAFSGGGALGLDSFSGTLSSSGNNAGGLIGNNSGLIDQVYSLGTVTDASGSYVGGLIGINSGNVSHVFSMSSVTGGTYVGGLIGQNSGPLSESYATGSVQGNNYVGGLVGLNAAGYTISEAYATGTVGNGTYLGGLVGRNNGSIVNSYATGGVNGFGGYQGGLVGDNFGAVQYSYASGVVGGTFNAGALIGDNESGASVSNVFYASAMNPLGPASSGTSSGVYNLTGSNFTAADLAPYPRFDSSGVGFNTASNGSFIVYQTNNGIWRIQVGDQFPVLTDLSAQISGVDYSGFGTAPNAGATVSLHAGSYSFGSTTTDASGNYAFLLPEDQVATYQESNSSSTLRVTSSPVSGAADSETIFSSPYNNFTVPLAYADHATDIYGKTLRADGAGLSNDQLLNSGSSFVHTSGSTNYFGGTDITTLLDTVLENSYTQNGSLTTQGNLTVESTLYTPNNYTVQTYASGNSTLYGTISTLTLDTFSNVSASAPGLAVVLASDGSFVNNAGSGAISSPNGYWEIELPTPDAGITGTGYFGNYGGLVSLDSLSNPVQAIYNVPVGGIVPFTADRYAFNLQPALNVTPDDIETTYSSGDSSTVPTDTYTPGGYVNASTYGNVFEQDDSTNTLSGAPVITSTAPTTWANANNYTISLANGTLNAYTGYLITPGTGTLQVDPSTSAVTVNIDDQTQNYGTATPPTYTYTTTGLAGDPNTPLLSTGPTISSPVTQYSPVAGSPYVIAGTGATTNANYTGGVNYVDGSFTVLPSTSNVVVTINNQSQTYGTAAPLTYSATGLAGDPNALFSTNPTLTSGGAGAYVSGSPYHIVGAGAIAPNYSGVTYRNVANTATYGLLNVNPAPLQIVANDLTSTVGIIPPLTAQGIGLVNGDNSSVITGLTTNATSNSPVGNYVINAYSATAGPNYYITGYLNGSLTLVPADQFNEHDRQLIDQFNAFPNDFARLAGRGIPRLVALFIGDPSFTGDGINTGEIAGLPNGDLARGSFLGQFVTPGNGYFSIVPGAVLTTPLPPGAGQQFQFFLGHSNHQLSDAAFGAH